MAYRADSVAFFYKIERALGFRCDSHHFYVFKPAVLVYIGLPNVLLILRAFAAFRYVGTLNVKAQNIRAVNAFDIAVKRGAYRFHIHRRGRRQKRSRTVQRLILSKPGDVTAVCLYPHATVSMHVYKTGKNLLIL